MNRRAFFTVLTGAVTSPLVARAQQSERLRRISWLGLGRADLPSAYLESLRAGLRELGWVEGRNLHIGVFWATGRTDMQDAARAMLATNPEVIVAQELMVYAVQPLNPSSAVVFGFSGDPVNGKLVQSYARPGGNFTGMSYLAVDLVGKRIELLKEWRPQIRHLAILARPQHPGVEIERHASEAVASKLQMDASYFSVFDEAELNGTFADIKKKGCDALVVFPDTTMLGFAERIAQFALDAGLPSVSGWERFAEQGLLLTYGPNVRELYRSLARYVDRILRGAKAAELPVELPTRYELVINLKTAKALGLEVPPMILARADVAIE